MDNHAYHDSEGQTEVSSDLELLLAPPPASTGLRFADLIIDTIIFYVIAMMAGGIIGAVSAFLPIEHDATAFQFVYLLGSLSIQLLYYTLMEGLTGRTIGKLITGTKVVKDTGEPITIKDALLRTLSRFVPFEAFSGFGVPWHDSWTHTTVVKIMKN